MPALYDHVRPTDADVEPGVYRVVGTDDGVTLLRVGDADGRRVSTGEVQTVTDLSGFETATNPDGNRSVGTAVGSVGESLYWELRAFATTLANHPVPTLVAVTLFVAGIVGEEWLPGPESLGGLLAAVGALGLAYVGSGRLD